MDFHTGLVEPHCQTAVLKKICAFCHSVTPSCANFVLSPFHEKILPLFPSSKGSGPLFLCWRERRLRYADSERRWRRMLSSLLKICAEEGDVASPAITNDDSSWISRAHAPRAPPGCRAAHAATTLVLCCAARTCASMYFHYACARGSRIAVRTLRSAYLPPRASARAARVPQPAICLAQPPLPCACFITRARAAAALACALFHRWFLGELQGGQTPPNPNPNPIGHYMTYHVTWFCGQMI